MHAQVHGDPSVCWLGMEVPSGGYDHHLTSAVILIQGTCLELQLGFTADIRLWANLSVITNYFLSHKGVV